MNKITLALAVLTLAGCNPENNAVIETTGDFVPKILVAATSPDYSTSDVVVIGNSDTEVDVVIEQQIHTTDPADIAIAVNGNDFYRLGRYGYDNITKVNFDVTSNVVSLDWQFSVLGDDYSANPADMVVVSNSSAYISRADSSKLWQVNPSASVEADFFIDEIDLSSFATVTNGNPFMADLELVGTKLFVLLTALDENWAVTGNSKVVVIDTSNNAVIDTDTVTEGIQAIELPGRNASEFSFYNNLLYVAATGDAYNFSDDTYKYSGGVITVDTTTYATALLIDDGDLTAAPYGNIVGVDVSADGDVYFVGYAGWGDNSVHVQRSGETSVTEINIGEGTFNIADIKVSGDRLYVGVFAQAGPPVVAAGLKVVDRTTNTVTKFIETTYNPGQIIALP